MHAHATHTIGSKSGNSRLGTRITAGFVGTILAGSALAAMSASPAAATTHATLSTGYTWTFPTWGWGKKTTFCVISPAGVAANVRISLPSGAGENVTTSTSQGTNPTCIERSWWGAPIIVQNVGGPYVWVWTF